jgi:hypothetical protein
MNQSITYRADTEPGYCVDDSAIRTTSLVYGGLVQVPTVGQPVTIPNDIQETALIIVSEMEFARAESLRLIEGA